MLIDTKVFHAMAAKHPEWRYRLYPREVEQEGGKRDYAYDFFQTGIDPKTKHYLSEDFFFVEQARHLGFETYFVPDAITKHIGSFEYVNNLSFLAASGVGVSGRNIKFEV